MNLEKLYEEFATDEVTVSDFKRYEELRKKAQYGDILAIDAEMDEEPIPKSVKNGRITVYYDLQDNLSFKSLEEVESYIAFAKKIPVEYSIKRLGLEI